MGEMMKLENETEIKTIVETDDCFAYTAEEPDGEITYHLQINNVTLHFFNEEWQVALKFLKEVVREFPV
jgi:hypothetical protein